LFVAAHQQNPGTRTQIGELSGQIAATHPGQDHICKQQINRPQASAASLQCFSRASGNYELVADGLEGLRSRLPDKPFVFDQQNGFWPAPLAG
jgi:hypothetical protein